MHKPPRLHWDSWLRVVMLQVLMLKVWAAMADITVLELMGAKADCTQLEPIWAHVVLHVW